MLKIFEFGIFLLTLGYFFFYRLITGEFSIVSIILVFITLVDWLFFDI